MKSLLKRAPLLGITTSSVSRFSSQKVAPETDGTSSLRDRSYQDQFHQDLFTPQPVLSGPVASRPVHSRTSSLREQFHQHQSTAGPILSGPVYLKTSSVQHQFHQYQFTPGPVLSGPVPSRPVHSITSSISTSLLQQHQ